MQIEKLLEDIKKFDEGVKHIVKYGDEKMCMGCGIKVGGIKDILKQFIDGLVECNNAMRMEEFHDCASHPLEDCECIGKWVGNNIAVNKMNLNLKEIRKQLK